MRILVSGGMGYIGSHTCVDLIEAGHEPIILDDLSNADIAVLDKIARLTGKRPTFYEVDIKDEKKVEDIFDKEALDGVIHFAGYKAVGESVAKPLEYYQNNVAGSLVLYKAMQRHDIKTIVFSSSATVYGDSFPIPFKEAYGMGETTNPYGTTKKFNEIILADWAKADPDLSVISLRYFNPIGAHPSGLLGEDPKGMPNNLLPYIAKVAIGEIDYVRIFGDDYDTPDGTGVRDYIHVCDLAKAHIKALEYAVAHKGYEVINVGSGKGYSVLEVLRAYEKACGKDLPYKISERRPGDIAVSYADTAKAKDLLGFEATLDIEDMCRDSYRYISTNSKN